MSSGTPRPARSRSPRGTLSRETIVEAAITVLDRDGFEALTTRRLAAELGVRPMSLYTHFRDKNAILAAVRHELVERVTWPTPSDDDIEWLRQVMRANFQLYTEHPALIQFHDRSETIDELEAQTSEQIYACLERLNLDHRTAIGLLATLNRFVLGCAMLYPSRRAWDEDPQHWERVRQRWASVSPEAYPSMRALTTDFPTFTQWETFEFGLDLILAPFTASGGRRPDGDPTPEQPESPRR